MNKLRLVLPLMLVASAPLTAPAFAQSSGDGAIPSIQQGAAQWLGQDSRYVWRWDSPYAFRRR
jgi:hypothetical protein